VKDNIIKAVKELTAKKSLEMRMDCEKRANDFSLENFEMKLHKILHQK